MDRQNGAFSTPSFQPSLSRSDRRATGIYYTPPQIVRLMVDLTLEPLLAKYRRPPKRAETLRPAIGAPRVLDPACGAGEFLVEAFQRLAAACGAFAARQALHGIDIDESAVADARRRLQELDSASFGDNVAVADALEDSFVPESYDVVLANPPYINIRQLARSVPKERIAQWRSRFRTARGNFDLYVLFIERALELLRPGGRCGIIIPNKWATLDYARECRELLLKQTTIEHVIDLSESRAFGDASVYPHVLVFRKEPAKQSHALNYHKPSLNPELEATASRLIETAPLTGVLASRSRSIERVRQRTLDADAISFTPVLDVESRVATRPLGEIAIISCGTAGYAAQRIAQRLRNSTEGVPYGAVGADFITSGNIDRYTIRLGNVRYLGRNYKRPRLPLDAPELTAEKRRLFAQPKIVIAGMSRRLEAAWDDRGLALGVQVYAASRCQIDPFYVLALLNSKLLSYLFATRFASKRLAGGYLAINKGQLVRLPIAFTTARVPSAAKGLAELARSCTGQAGSLPYDEEIDRMVYRLYRLTDGEVALVEGHFAQATRRAA